jgi:hypothetical protein
MERLLAM